MVTMYIGHYEENYPNCKQTVSLEPFIEQPYTKDNYESFPRIAPSIAGRALLSRPPFQMILYYLARVMG